MSLCIKGIASELAQENTSMMRSLDLVHEGWQNPSTVSNNELIPGSRLIKKYNGTIELLPKTPGEIIGEQIVRPVLDATLSVAKSTLNILTQGFNLLDRGMSKMFQILPAAQATDVGQIAYFEGSCPEGWKKYVQAEGRFVIAAGSFRGRSYDGRVESASYSTGQKGGEIKHRSTINEMPHHKHDFRVNKNGAIGEGVLLGNTPNEGPGYSGGGYYHLGISSARMRYAGGNRPHNNMPPYIALQACQKIKDIELSGYAQSSDLTTTAQQTQSTLAVLKKTIESHQRSSNATVLAVSSRVAKLQKDLESCKRNVTWITANLKQAQSKDSLQTEMISFRDRFSLLDDQVKSNRKFSDTLLSVIDQLKSEIAALKRTSEYERRRR
ncbi:hypothetical protein TrispH2_007243 [Trichoplax sp. H2]|uniref:Uncharacterized protein n=1 Tax=Trichoplax adhaerens TaxID=10228 RepID=B3S9A8_TRIAD|nr:hypothetical protein TRIADDRAFT_60837 [Trichoplax adhaerens]EDV20613.1 hypothetical protein TRIADDRAFT_60837 [Trichoplax adhaerens]RDD40613.1 hypothetical protein TrispH2_007243 [Trichoplax sp. H2]|eukprot:XP_002116813.1 hypothetical protein TRIADDRAFT_60837 [Trichoplax adhaerens]